MLKFSGNKVENRKTFRRVAAHSKGARRAVRRFMFAMAEDIRREADRAVRDDPKTGGIYRNVRLPGGRIKRVHRASAPGESHADLSRRLRKSLGWKVHGTKSFDVGYGVAPDRKNPMPPHGQYVEEGTKRMDARPTVLNAINKRQGEADRHWARALEREL